MTVGELQWRVPRKVPIGKLVVAAIVVLLAVVAAEGPWQTAAALAVAAGFAGWAARDLLVPVRLAAGPSGLTVVTGLARRHQLGWSQVARVRVDVRRRSRMLEIDSGDHLYLFSRYDLDADLDRVAEELRRLRSGTP